MTDSTMANQKRSFLQRCLHFIHSIEDGMLVLLLCGMILLASAQIFLRNFFDFGFSWSDPLLRVMVLWLGLLGGLAASRDGKHITIDALAPFIPDSARHAVALVTQLFTILVCSIIAWHGARFAFMDYEMQTMAFSKIPIWYFESIIPFAFGMIAVRYCIHATLSVFAIARQWQEKKAEA
ncbi:MAG: TRAP transporter small permease [Gammaproteobacteria bacterium]|nr:TRAP transporter small permease [Gammaproteobacteria bacterium]